MDANIDFSNEDWGKSVKFYDGCWVIAEKHNPALNKTMELNNRTFVFQLINKEGKDSLLVMDALVNLLLKLLKNWKKKLVWK